MIFVVCPHRIQLNIHQDKTFRTLKRMMYILSQLTCDRLYREFRKQMYACDNAHSAQLKKHWGSSSLSRSIKRRIRREKIAIVSKWPSGHHSRYSSTTMRWPHRQKINGFNLLRDPPPTYESRHFLLKIPAWNRLPCMNQRTFNS